MASKPSIGGQAVIEGVMMRGPSTWAVAVRQPDGAIACETHTLPGRGTWARLPFVRGIFVLAESMVIGIKALKIAAQHAMGSGDDAGTAPKEELSLGWAVAVAVAFFVALFVAAPAVAVKLGGRLLSVRSPLWQNLAEGLLRIGLFLGYLLAISLLPDVRRVFQYHGAEHKTIYAYENDDPFEPEVIDRYPTLHVRCGTNFLFIVMFLTIGVHLALDLVLPPGLLLRVGARVLIVPVLAGLAYEVIKAAGRSGDSGFFRMVSLPGLALQKVTTRPPTRDQIEVAIKAMEAVIGRESLKEGAATQRRALPVLPPGVDPAPVTPS